MPLGASRTGNGSEERWDTWRQMTGLTRQPKEVETAWAASPRGLKRAEKEKRRAVRGRSSLTTTHVRTHERLMPFDYREGGKRGRGGKRGERGEEREREERREGGGEEREEGRGERGGERERRGERRGERREG